MDAKGKGVKKQGTRNPMAALLRLAGAPKVVQDKRRREAKARALRDMRGVPG